MQSHQMQERAPATLDELLLQHQDGSSVLKAVQASINHNGRPADWALWALANSRNPMQGDVDLSEAVSATLRFRERTLAAKTSVVPLLFQYKSKYPTWTRLNVDVWVSSFSRLTMHIQGVDENNYPLFNQSILSVHSSEWNRGSYFPTGSAVSWPSPDLWETSVRLATLEGQSHALCELLAQLCHISPVTLGLWPELANGCYQILSSIERSHLAVSAQLAKSQHQTESTRRMLEFSVKGCWAPKTADQLDRLLTALQETPSDQWMALVRQELGIKATLTSVRAIKDHVRAHRDAKALQVRWRELATQLPALTR